MRRRRINGLFEPMTEFISLRRAFDRASAGKRERLAILSFQADLENNLWAIREELRAESYKFGPYRSFYVHEPKTRLIESACFRDRVVHHALVEVLEPIYEAKFYEYSFACRTGRGTHAAMLTLHDWVRRTRAPFFLKCDIRKYFPSVNRERLFAVIERSVADERVLRLIHALIQEAPRSGIPIGNLTSQLFANVYLNELDQFVKRSLRVRHYIRYMDDFIMLTDSHAEALRLRDTVKEFLSRELSLELSPEKVRIGRAAEGIPFVGYCVRPERIRVRGAALRRIRKKVRRAFRGSFGRSWEMPAGFWEDVRTRRSRFYGTWSSFVGQTNFADDGPHVQRKMIHELQLLPP